MNTRTPRIAAFFDLDNTIIPGPAIELQYFALLWRQNLVGVREITRSAGVVLRDFPSLSLDSLRRYKAYLAGKDVSTIEAPAMSFFWERVCPRISEEARLAIERHRGENHRVVLITGCPEFLVAPLATFLKIDDVVAGRLERAGSTYTGCLLEPYPYREGKRRVIEQLAGEHGLELAASYMYGDSPGDLPALEAVGHPRVVNPIRGMSRIARHRGWSVLTWQ